MIPNKINIMGHVYKIKKVDDLKLPDGRFLFGSICHVHRIIEINSDMNNEVERTTLIHEIFHGITHLAGHSDIDSAIDERLVDCIAQALLPLIEDNPKFIPYITKKKDK